MSAGRELLIGFRRAPLLSLLSVVTIAFALFAVGLFGLVALNIQRALAQVDERVQIRAFLLDDAGDDARVAAISAISRFPEVASVDYVSPDQALVKARQELGEFSDVFESGFLPASLEIRLRAGKREPATIARVVGRIRGYDAVEDVRYGSDWVQKFYDIRNVAAAAGLVLGATFAAVAMIIIGASIRMTVLARAAEIAIMRLVGATDGYIRRPFLLDGLLKGLAGGVLALLLTWLANAAITRYVIPTAFLDTRSALLGVAAGGLLGLLASALSVSRHLRRV